MASWSSQIREKFRQFGQWISSFQQFGKGSSCSSIAQVKQIRVSNDFIMAIIPLSQRQVLLVFLSHTLPRVVAELQCVQVCVRRVWCVCVSVRVYLPHYLINQSKSHGVRSSRGFVDPRGALIKIFARQTQELREDHVNITRLYGQLRDNYCGTYYNTILKHRAEGKGLAHK